MDSTADSGGLIFAGDFAHARPPLLAPNLLELPRAYARAAHWATLLKPPRAEHEQPPDRPARVAACLCANLRRATLLEPLRARKRDAAGQPRARSAAAMHCSSCRDALLDADAAVPCAPAAAGAALHLPCPARVARSWIFFFLPLLDGRESTVLPSNRTECYFRITVLSFSSILRSGVLSVVFSESRNLSML